MHVVVDTRYEDLFRWYCIVHANAERRVSDFPILQDYLHFVIVLPKVEVVEEALRRPGE